MAVIKRELLEFDPQDPTGSRVWETLGSDKSAPPSAPARPPETEVASKDWWTARVARITKYKGPSQGLITGWMDLWDQLTNDRFEFKKPGADETSSETSSETGYATSNDNGGGYA